MNKNLIARLKSLDSLKSVPVNELNWLSDHGNLETYPPGLIIPKGTKVEFMWIILTGHISLHVDSGAGPKVANTELVSGSVTGVLPYSRLKEIPGDLYADEKTELISISTGHFPQLIINCPSFTAHTVHMMIDRTRIYNTSAMQDEKMISLGRMSAGLAHEINNPSSVVIRDIKLIRECQSEMNDAMQILLESGIEQQQVRLIREFHSNQLKKSQEASFMTPLQRSDYVDSVCDWLERKQMNTIDGGQLAELHADPEELEKLLAPLSAKYFQPAVKWLIASNRFNQLTNELESSATKIHKLVEAVKEFTSMDSLAEKEQVDIESGINTAVKMLDAKIRSKQASVMIEIGKNVPQVSANSAALNQVWFNLLENALDAIPLSGEIKICVDAKNDRILIRFIDNGPGIPPEKISRIFDPFFTTKPPGQGTGLGLDLSRRIIRRYKGDISVHCETGKTEFCVNFRIHRS